MSCYFPQHGFIHPYRKHHTGGDFLVIASQKITEMPFSHFDLDTGLYFTTVVKEFLEIPCGCCVGCQLDHSADWTARILAEASTSRSAYFITLTYNDNNLKYRSVADPDTGELISELPTLFKKDLQDFHKRLRSNQKRKFKNKGVRFYACGEYGPKTYRPHYHGIYFNIQLPFPLGSPQCPIHKFNFAGDPIYRCEYISDLWQNGFITIAPVNDKTAGYVSRYTLKKLYKNDLSISKRVKSYRYSLLDSSFLENMDIKEKENYIFTNSLDEQTVLKLFKRVGLYDIEYTDNIIPSFYLQGRISSRLLDMIVLEIMCKIYREKEEFLDFATYGPYSFLEPEFQLSSTSPGLGYDYLMQHANDIVETLEFTVMNRKFRIPRYFCKKLKEEDPVLYESFNEARRSKGRAKYNQWCDEHPGEVRSEWLKLQHSIFKDKVKILKYRSNI